MTNFPYGVHMVTPTEYSASVAHHVTQALQSNSQSVKATAEATGIARVTLTRRLTGRSPFNVAELEAIAQHLGTTVSDLLPRKRAS